MNDINILLAVFASELYHKSVSTNTIELLADRVTNDWNESLCISICNIMFAYYKGQYVVCTTDFDKSVVIKEFSDIYQNVIGDTYINIKTIIDIFKLSMSRNDMVHSLALIENVAKDDGLHRFTNSCIHIYKSIINYIINKSLFCVEPYAGIMESMLRYVTNNDMDGKSPEYLS